MADKDFLSQFSGKTKPDSFKEEERIKITKPKKPVNTKLIAIILASVLVVTGITIFIIFRPTIEVKDFVGLDSTEAKAWIKQNDIDTQGIIFREEYNFEYDEGYIVSQSIEANKKVRKNVKMDFVVSKGADPDEIISVPDIENMTKDELQNWVKENKLTKTKIMTAYSDEKEMGEVISFEFKNSDPDNFKRSSTLNITVSKGPQPAGVVTVEDFVKQDYSVVEAWGKKNKIDVVKATKYDDKIAKDLVISQSVEAKKTLKEGESLTVVVSLGKGIKVPNFAAMTNSDVDEWIKDNSAYVKKKEKYSNDGNYVLEQSVKTGSYIGEDSKLELTINLGDHFYLDEIGFTIVDNSYDKFKDYALTLEEKGIYLDTHRNYVDSSKPKNTILSIEKIYSGNNTYSEVQKLPLEVDVTCNISNGNLVDKIRLPYERFIDQPYSNLKEWLVENHESGIECNTSIVDDTKKVLTIEYQIDVGTYENIITCDGYLNYGTEIKVTTEE